MRQGMQRAGGEERRGRKRRGVQCPKETQSGAVVVQNAAWGAVWVRRKMGGARGRMQKEGLPARSAGNDGSSQRNKMAPRKCSKV